jgi:hypothetical protein
MTIIQGFTSFNTIAPASTVAPSPTVTPGPTKASALPRLIGHPWPAGTTCVFRTAIGQIRRNPRRFLIRYESRTEDNQDSKDHFAGPLNKRKDTKISCILSCFFRVFRGQTSPECSSGVRTD